jgi:hypothetical protein
MTRGRSPAFRGARTIIKSRRLERMLIIERLPQPAISSCDEASRGTMMGCGCEVVGSGRSEYVRQYSVGPLVLAGSARDPGTRMGPEFVNGACGSRTRGSFC